MNEYEDKLKLYQDVQAATEAANKPPVEPSEREQKMIVLRSEGKTLEEIAPEFGITRERVRQILAKFGLTGWVKDRPHGEVVRFICDQCGAEREKFASQLIGKNRVFCDMKCYRQYKAEHHVGGWTTPQEKYKLRNARTRDYRLAYYRQHRARILQYRRDNKERLNEYHRQYNAKNREKVSVRQKAYYQRHKEEIKAKWRVYYQKNKEALNAKGRANYHRRKGIIKGSGRGQ